MKPWIIEKIISSWDILITLWINKVFFILARCNHLQSSFSSFFVSNAVKDSFY